MNVPNVVVVHPSLNVKTVGELIALLKANPGKYETPRPVSAPRCTCRVPLFESMADVKMVHVPYKGAGPALVDVMGGQVKIMFDNLPSSIGHIRKGSLVGLASPPGTLARRAGHADRVGIRPARLRDL